MDLLVKAPRLSVPILFWLGRHDAVAQSELPVRYLDTGYAPKKRLVWFERSAHCLHPKSLGALLARSPVS